MLLKNCTAPGCNTTPVVMEQPDRLSRLSDVFYKLESESKKRYIEKISLINNEDPFALKKTDLSQDESLLPSLR